jgi:hypothetical protein
MSQEQTNSVNISVGGYIVHVAKLDDDEYEFRTTHEYLEYSGKSFIKLFALIDNINGLVDYAESYKIGMDFFEDHIMLTFPIPFSKKNELVKLNKPIIDEITEISVAIKRQERCIKELKRQIQVLSDDLNERKKTVIPPFVYLNIVFTVDHGAYIDYAEYYKQPGANKKNVEFLMACINDEYGFGHKQSGTNENICYPGVEVQFSNGEKVKLSSKFSSFDNFISDLGNECSFPTKAPLRYYIGLIKNNTNPLIPLSNIGSIYNEDMLRRINLYDCFTSDSDTEPSYYLEEGSILEESGILIGRWAVPSKTFKYIRIPKHDEFKFRQAVLENVTTHDYFATKIAYYLIQK